MRHLLFPCILFFVGCKPAEVASKDLLRDARIGCERGDAVSCFHAGALSAEEQGGGARAIGFFARGCVQKHGPSCDGLAGIKGPQRESALVEGCNAGDMLSCARLADDYPKDADGLKRAKALREQVCRQAIVLKEKTPARDVHGAAEGCAKLAAMHASAEGAPGDPIRALKLETLATLLRTEALTRYVNEDDITADAYLKSKTLTPNEKDRRERQSEIEDKAREALMATVDKKDKEIGSSSSPVTPIELLFFGNIVLPAPPQTTGDDGATCRDTGDPISCAIAAAQAEHADPTAPLELHAAGCAKKPDSCWGLITFAEILLRRRDAARATWLLERGCEAKSAMACTRLGAELEQGERGITQDLPKAAKTLDKGCQLGSPRACLLLSALVEDGRGAKADPNRAKALRTKANGFDRPRPASASPSGDEDACRKTKDSSKCLTAAAAVQEYDAGKAEELYKIGCAADKPTCGLWSFAINRFRKDDAGRGMRLLESGCLEGVSLACHALGEVLHLGWRSVARDELRAAEMYGKACDGGDSAACRTIASRYRMAKDATKADEIRDKALKVEEDSVKGDSGDRWARDFASQRAKGPHAVELDRARAEFRAQVEKAKARAQARDQRAAAAAAGKKLQPLPPPSKEEAEASTTRVNVIRISASSLVAPPEKPEKK